MGRLAKIARQGSAPGARDRAMNMAHGRGPQGEVTSRARAAEYTETDPGTNQQLVDASKTPSKAGSPGDADARTMNVPGRFEDGAAKQATGPLTPRKDQGIGRNNPRPETSQGAEAGDQNAGTMAAPVRVLGDKPQFVDGAFTEPTPSVMPSQKAKSGAEVRTGDSSLKADGASPAQATGNTKAPGGTYADGKDLWRK